MEHNPRGKCVSGGITLTSIRTDRLFLIMQTYRLLIDMDNFVLLADIDR